MCSYDLYVYSEKYRVRGIELYVMGSYIGKLILDICAAKLYAATVV
jgi:hypothetical protein